MAGDGTGDHLLATGVAAVAPAWRPGHPYQVAYVRRRRVVVQDADSGRVSWIRSAGGVVKLEWSSGGGLLLILTRRGALVLTGSGETAASVIVGRANPVLGGSLSPNGRMVALVRGDGVAVARLGSARPAVSSVLTGAGIRQVLWSPNGRWLIANWPPPTSGCSLRSATARGWRHSQGSPSDSAMDRLPARSPSWRDGAAPRTRGRAEARLRHGESERGAPFSLGHPYTLRGGARMGMVRRRRRRRFGWGTLPRL